MLSEAYLDQYRDKKIPFGPVGEIVYKRTYSREKEEGVKESWLETQARCVNSIAEMSKGALTQKEQEELFDLVFNLKGSFSGRGLWQLGTDTVDRFGLASLNNCWAVAVDKPEAFCFTFDMLMLGGGVGFNIQREFVYRLPSVTPSEVQIKHVKGVDADFMVPDSREGWVDLLWRVLEVYFDLDRPYRGRTRETKGFTYSTANIRGKGEAILGFGGKASGPQVLVDGIEQICTVFNNRRGKMLRPIDCLDIMNIIGSVVVAGNVRRSAQIALGDTDDYQFLEAKRWDRGTIPNWRAMSNNTFIANEFGHIREETWLGYEGKGEPYGFLNLNLVKNYGRLIDGHNESDIHVIGTNPCVPDWTWVMTDNGPAQVKDLQESDFTAMVDGKPYSAKAFWSTGVKDIYALRLASGHVVEATDNHEILTEGGWKELGQIEVGERVCLHNHEDLEWKGSGGSEDEGYVAGHLVGDGTYNPSGDPIWCVWSQDEGSEACADVVFKTIDACSKHRSDWQGWRDAYQDGKRVLTSRKFQAVLENYGIRRGNKTITDTVETSSSEFYKGFIRGLFDTDGHIEGYSTKGGVSIRISQSDREFMTRLQRMLSRLGIHSSVYDLFPEREKDLPGGTYACKASYRLSITGKNAERFMKRIGFTNTGKVAKWEERTKDMKKGFYDKPFMSEVVAVEYVDTVEVFDTSVEEEHRFDANGVVVHNCGEISLEDGEACNLNETFAPNIKTEEELIHTLCSVFRTSKIITTLPCHWGMSEEVIHRNRRIGTSLTGIWQSELLTPKVLDRAYKALEECDEEFSRRLSKATGQKVEKSIKRTTVKPSGTLSLLAGVAPGIHPEFANHYIRRIRMASTDPLVNQCREAGYFVEYVRRFDGTEDHDTVCVEFPVEARPGKVADDVTAIEMLEKIKMFQTYWSDNQVSATVYYTPEELPLVQDWLDKNYDEGIKSISFLLKQNHGFDQAPIEPISAEVFREKSDAITGQLGDVQGDLLEMDECSSGGCPIR